MVNAVPDSAAPQPMPYWLPASGPRAPLRDSNDQPCAPIAKPWASRYAKPDAPMARSTLARASLDSGTRRNAAAVANRTPIGRSQVRPYFRAWTKAGALSLDV